MTEEEFKKPLSIPEEANVYRQTSTSYLTKAKGNDTQRFPRENHFSSLPDGLSVNWDGHCDINYAYHIIGLSYKPKQPGVFKDFKDFHLFKIPVAFLRNLDGIEDVLHNPMFNGNPAPIGSPNNYAHTLVLYPDDEEIRVKISDYCRDYYKSCYCKIDLDMIEDEIKALKARLDNTEYHRLLTDDAAVVDAS